MEQAFENRPAHIWTRLITYGGVIVSLSLNFRFPWKELRSARGPPSGIGRGKWPKMEGQQEAKQLALVSFSFSFLSFLKIVFKT